MNDRIIHDHAPLRRHSGGLLIRRGRHRREAQLRGQPGRDLLMRRQPPGSLLGTKPFLRLGILAVIRGQLDQPQFGAQRQGPALAAAQGGKARRLGRRAVAGGGPVLGGPVPGIRPPLPAPPRPALANPQETSILFSWQFVKLTFCRLRNLLPPQANNSVKMHPVHSLPLLVAVRFDARDK